MFQYGLYHISNFFQNDIDGYIALFVVHIVSENRSFHRTNQYIDQPDTTISDTVSVTFSETIFKALSY